MIDEKGYRRNVGMIIINEKNKVFWGRRVGQKSWQFPQGGIDSEESIIEAMYRELWEETGLKKEHVKILGKTSDWLSYNLPKRYRRKNTFPLCIGQKQHWFILRLIADDKSINFNCSNKAEFDDFRWVDYWYPIYKVIYFKKDVYSKALYELCSFADIRPQRSRYPYRYKKKSKFNKRPNR